jgi:propionyl-CoA carboxylase alpha chain
MISSVLVANRGEIARRVFRTCRDLGIATVAVHSTADADAPSVREADAAVHLPGSSAAETYLRGDLLIDAAHRSGADAIHPGYGFLSENAEFARDVIAAGLTWIGPPPESIDSMGSKIEAKAMMGDAGVPVLGRLDPSEITGADLPLLIKASSGGGGRGMRIVTDLAALQTELEIASAEAASAFGDPTVFCEPYLATGRHIEVQVMADTHGTIWTVGERECSIQRRHQKIVEEAPSPLVERIDGMRERLFDASRAAAAAIGYVGAGTVEFLADDDGTFYFLEMNTRLQVEHPVTEATTGTDLVALQLKIAEGGALDDEPPPGTGHSIEVRLYAEDPAQDWQPQSGTLERFSVPGVTSEFENATSTDAASSWVRLDSGVVDGSVVGVHYDPMLAKVISWAPSRDDAARRLAAALRGARIHGVHTNRDLLVRILHHDSFLAGDTDSAFLDRHGLDALSRPLIDDSAVAVSALAAALAVASANRLRLPVLAGLPIGWRNIASQPQRRSFRALHHGRPGTMIDVEHRLTRKGLSAVGHDDVELISAAPDLVVLALAGVQRRFEVADHHGLVCVDSPLGSVELESVERFPDATEQSAPGSLLAPMPGAIVRIAVVQGEHVQAGQPLLWLEAMKMQHQISAPVGGTVTELHITEGQLVDVGAVLAVVTEEGT